MRPEALIETVEPPIAVDLRRHARAGRYSLRYDAVRDRLRLTLPRRASKRAALRWAAGETQWIERQRTGRVEAVPLVPDTQLPFRGGTLTLVHDNVAGRRVMRDGDCLVTGGSIDTIARRYERWLRDEALRLLSRDAAHYADLAGVRLTGVAVGDARSRWGSCSATGRLRFSWRLLLAPDPVRRYVVAHEVAHRVHMDHSPAFRALEAELFEGDSHTARRQLRAIGPTLLGIGA